MAKISGLTDQEVIENREKFGSNKIKEAPPESFWSKFLGNLNDPMLKLLIGISAIMVLMWIFGQAGIHEPIGTIITIILVATITAKTEMASDKAYRNLKKSMPKEMCKALRNGVLSVIDQDEVVVGDVILLQSGDKIPADGYLIEGEIRVNNSALNGETEECKKTAACSDFQMADEITGDTFVDAHSLFRGAVVYNGDGKMYVKRCGIGNPDSGYPGTMMGKMAQEMEEDEPDSPLKVKLAKLAKQISTFGYVGAIVLAIAYMVHFIIVAGGINPYLHTGWVNILKDFIKAAQLAIVIIVCAVPEGLPLMISIVLMSNTGEMLKHNVLVRKAIGIETAGSLNTLFSDKTGTITKGVLEVVEFFNGAGDTMDVRNVEGKTRDYLRLAIGKNTAAMFDENHMVVGGNMTDKALLSYLGEAVFNTLNKDDGCAVTAQQGFNSSNKFSSSYLGNIGKTFYKGAPEKLFAKANKYVAADGSIQNLDHDVVDRKSTELANRAMRLLAFGYSEKELVENEINDDLVLIGIAAIRDDVRPEAIDAIRQVESAGIHVCMITGDRKETACAIAREAGLVKSDEDIVITSEELNKMSDDEIMEKFTRIKCIARALPTDKSRMVRIGQRLNRVCGMTGDGVNDSPALKVADVGFAMGKSGTDAAKEAADLVIIDDNFASIRNAVLYGRTIYLNILKFCRFQLAINVAAVFSSAILPFLGVEAPLTVTQMLALNLVMDSLGALLLGKEYARESYMTHPPKRRDESIITKNIFIQFVAMGLYITALSIAWFKVPFFRNIFETGSVGDLQFKSAFFAFFIFASIFNGFNVRTDRLTIFRDLDKNPNFMKVWCIMLLTTIVLCMIDIIPGLGFIGEMFQTTHFGINGWILVTLYAVTVIPVDMIRKVICKTYIND